MLSKKAKEQLVQLADDLDQKGFGEEANEIDKIVKWPKVLKVSIEGLRNEIPDNDLSDLIGERLQGLIDSGNLDASQIEVSVIQDAFPDVSDPIWNKS